MATSVSIDRTSLGLPPLVIGVDGDSTYTVTVGGLGRPAVTARTTYAGDSPYLHGQTPIAVVRENSSLPLTVLLQGDTDAALRAAAAALDAALWQFTYNVTVTEGSTATTWLCSPASYGLDSSAVTSDNVAEHYEVWAITIPVYPIPAVS